MPKRKRWTKEEEQWLKENYQKFSNKELAEKFGVSETSIQKKLASLGLTRQQQKKWTKEDEEFLKENYESMSIEELAKKFNVTPLAVKKKLARLGLSKRSKKRTSEQTEVIKVKMSTEALTAEVDETTTSSPSTSIEYKPNLSYEVGNIIYHPVWQEKGEVIGKTTTAGGHSAIIVRFETLGEKKLVERWRKR